MKPLETWQDRIPPVILKYFYLLSFIAGVSVSLFILTGAIFLIGTGQLWPQHFLSILDLLASFGFVVWATCEMFLAYRGSGLDKPKVN